MAKKPRVLVLGAGNNPHIKVSLTPSDLESEGKPVPFTHLFDEVVTIDMDAGTKPTYVWNLDEFPWPLNHFERFDEIHAYEVLEHLGALGDYESFFMLWREIWHFLKPGGDVVATTPWWNSVWALADPGHRRIYSNELVTYLNQGEYLSQVGRTPMTDYRAFWPKEFNFELIAGEKINNSFVFILRKEEWKPNDSNQSRTSGAVATRQGNAANEVLGGRDGGVASPGRGIRGDGSGPDGGIQRW